MLQEQLCKCFGMLPYISFSKLTELKGVKPEPANNVGKRYLENCVRAATQDLRLISEGKRPRPLRKTARDLPACRGVRKEPPS